VGVDSLDADSINIGRIELDDASVGTVQLSNMVADINSGSARLENVRTVVSIALSIDWRVRLPFVRDPRGTAGPIAIPIPFNLGNVDIDDIDTISVNVPDATVTGAQVEIQPIDNVGFDGGVANTINLSTLQMPSKGFAISGLSYDSFNLSHITLPDGDIASASIGSIVPTGVLTIPNTEIQNVVIPSVAVPNVNSTAPINIENAESDVIPPINIDLGIVVFTIRLTPTMDMNVERLAISDMQADSSIESISVQNMTSSVNVQDISISGIGLNRLALNQVSL